MEIVKFNKPSCYKLHFYKSKANERPICRECLLHGIKIDKVLKIEMSMKKHFLVIILLTGCLAATAQSKFSIGPNAGVGSSWITNSTAYANSKLSGDAGISMVYSAAEHFGIGADVKYAFEGAKTDATDPVSLNLNYIRVPLKAIYFFNKYGDRLRPKVSIGPSFGFLGTAKTETDNGTKTDVKSNFNSFDFGVAAAAGVNYKLVSSTWLHIDLNYLHGISDIRKNDNVGDGVHNRNVRLNVGVNFGI